MKGVVYGQAAPGAAAAVRVEFEVGIANAVRAPDDTFIGGTGDVPPTLQPCVVLSWKSSICPAVMDHAGAG